MSKKKKSQKSRQRQQKRIAGAAKERKRRRPYRPRTSPLAAYAPADLPDQQTLMRGMMEMESLAEEPEFDDFKLGEDALEIATKMVVDTDKEINRLEEIGDEAGIDQLVSEARWKPSPRPSRRPSGQTFAAVWSD